MENSFDRIILPRLRGIFLAIAAAVSVVACGGGDNSSVGTSQEATQLATGTITLEMDMPALPQAVAAQIAQPFFHAAPGVLAEPDDADALNSDTSARHAPRRHVLSAEFSGVSSRGLTVQDMQSPHRERAGRQAAMTVDGTSVPMATGGTIATYTPAQIRAAYGLPVLPALGASLSAAQAAQMGAGQTIYIVDARHNPNVAAELAAFNQKFGLPACTTKVIPATMALPLAAASSTGCELSIVYSTASGTMTSAVPPYDAGWATEIALDVQWAHATAPRARIVVIEAADPSLNNLLGAVKLANSMGPGMVSMSFGAPEGSWTSSVDSAFTGANMTYLAATGDSGAAVSWPSVSSKVVAVGGTTLTYTGTGPRSEVAWSGTGGGVSGYTPTPNYQSNAVPGMGTLGRRAVADVAFNADPASGQFVAVIPPGSTTVSWMSAGGTSISTPQWAGLIAVANANRKLASKAVLGAPHSVLYGQISTVPGTYASAFSDVTKGSDGTCALCTAKAGYDPLTGLGTPNAAALLNALTGLSAAPVVTPASISGTVGTALSFTVSVAAPNPVTYTLSGAPSGMGISSAGVVTWTAPVAGSYSIVVTAKDTKTLLSGQGTYVVTIAPPAPPVVKAATITGTAGTALSFATVVTAANPVTYTLSGAPSGMKVGTTGILAWPTPVAGTYSVTLIAKDTKTGLSGQGLFTVSISAPQAPVVTAATVNGRPATALSFVIAVVAPNPVTYTLSGAPTGMTVSSAGLVTWASPVLGTFTVTAIARDTKTGLTGQGIYTVKIAAAGPVITAPAMTGNAGVPLTGTISISDPGATSVSISIFGVPWGMGFSMSGLTITANWASPVVGTYSMKIVVVDSAGLTAQETVPITIR